MTVISNEENSSEIHKSVEIESDDQAIEVEQLSCDQKDDKEKEKKDGRTLPLSKIVVRRLPPSMTQDQFLDQVSPLPEYDYLYFAKADLSLGQYAFSRVYINFLNEDDIINFTERFDGYVFVDHKGIEYPALVEYAPFQKVPKNRSRKKDSKCATIEQDPDYLKFLEALQNPEEFSLPSAETCLEEIEAKERELKANNGVPKVITPLIEFVKLKKAEKQRIKEEKREIERKRREMERRRTKEEKKKLREPKERELKEKDKKVPEKKYPDRKDRKEDRERKDSQIVKLLKKADDDKSEKEECNDSVDKKPVNKFSEKSKDFDKDKKLRRDEERKLKEKKEKRKDLKIHKDKTERLRCLKEKKDIVQDKDVEDIELEASLCDAYKLKDENESISDASDRRKDPRSERRIRNKDRPSLEIYRPGMRRLKTVQPNSDKNSGKDYDPDLSRSSSPSPTLIIQHKSKEENDCENDPKPPENASNIDKESESVEIDVIDVTDCNESENTL